MASLHGVWTNFFEKFNGVLISLRSHISRQQRIAASRNANLIFIVFSLLSFLQIKSQGSNNDFPFLTHPKTCNVAIATLLLYGLAYDAEQRFSSTHPTVPNAARQAMGFFGSLLIASLASLLFPAWVQPILYVFYYVDELIDWAQRRFIDEPEQTDILPLAELCLWQSSLLTASLASILFPGWVLPILYLVYLMFNADELIDWLLRRCLGKLEEVDELPV